MKPVMGVVLAVLASVLTFAAPARAWNCTDPLASRVNVGATKPTGSTSGDGDGQYYIGSDASNPNDYYVCEVPTTPPTTTTGGNSNATSTSNSNSSSAANSASSSSATGGSSHSVSSATGGSATGGNATSGISNSGNSSVTNNVSASGGQGGAGGSSTATGGNQKQTQSQTLANSGNSAATASGNGVGNGNNSDNSSTTINEQRSVASAYSPSMNATAECFKPYSGGGQGLLFGASFGGGKIDENCAMLEASRQAPSRLARCKIFILNKYAKQGGVSLDDCMTVQFVSTPTPMAVVTPPAPQPIIPITVNVPAPLVTVIPPPTVAPTPTVAQAAKLVVHKPRPSCKCIYTNDGPVKK